MNDLESVWVAYGDGSAAEAVTLAPDGSSCALAHVYADDSPPAGTTVTVTATDIDGATGTATGNLAVTNADPVVGAITSPPAPVALGTPITVSIPFTDGRGRHALRDRHVG